MAIEVWRDLAQGWLVWAALGVVIWQLPGQAWRSAAPGAFPFTMAWVWLGAVVVLVGVVHLGVVWRGPALARNRLLVLLEAPPPLLWGALLCALWPAGWGPPGVGAWILGFVVVVAPLELRWMAQALPDEHPLPLAYGMGHTRRIRSRALFRLLGTWLAARWPMWLMSTLVIERLLGLRGLGTDWGDRLAHRDRVGLVAWLLAMAALWSLGRLRRRTCA